MLADRGGPGRLTQQGHHERAAVGNLTAAGVPR
jgi:hypothetical protein